MNELGRQPGWMPMRCYARDGQPYVDWCWAGARRFVEPFFDHTVDALLELPFNLALRPQTPLVELAEIAAATAAEAPSGFVFHLSRSGSTLLAQLLAAREGAMVVSEASVVDHVINAIAASESQAASGSQQMGPACLRGLLLSMGLGASRGYFVKWDPWHIVHLPLIRRAFPEVPWLFLYREPIEVMVSLSKVGGGRLLPGAVDPALLGTTVERIWQMPPEEYQARLLAHLCQTALDGCERYGGWLANYTELPELAWAGLPELFDFSCSPADQTAMAARAGMDSKERVQQFQADSEEKQAEASATLRSACRRWVEAPYRELEARRLAQHRAS